MTTFSIQMLYYRRLGVVEQGVMNFLTEKKRKGHLKLPDLLQNVLVGLPKVVGGTNMGKATVKNVLYALSAKGMVDLKGRKLMAVHEGLTEKRIRWYPRDDPPLRDGHYFTILTSGTYKICEYRKEATTKDWEEVTHWSIPEPPEGVIPPEMHEEKTE